MTRKNSNRILRKLRVVHDITTVGGEATGFISLSNILYSLNATNVANADYTACSTLYDSVRPCGVKISWIPESNTSIVATSGASYSQIYTATDYNDTLFTAPLFTNTRANLIEYNNMKYKNVLRPQKWYFKLKKQPQNLSLLPATSGTPATYGDVLMEPQSKLGYFSVKNMQGVDPSGAVTAKDIQAIWPNAGIFYYNIPTDQISDDQVIGTFLVTYYYAFIQAK